MVVDHANCLHEGIDDGWAAELEPTFRQVLGNFLRHGGFGRDLPRAAEFVYLGLAVEEAPQQSGKSWSLVHHLEPGTRREDRALDLHPVAYDAFIQHQALDLLRRIAGNLLRRE